MEKSYLLVTTNVNVKETLDEYQVIKKYTCLNTKEECEIHQSFGKHNHNLIKVLEELIQELNDDSQICTSDFSLALAIYDRILMHHPNITDEKLEKYLKIALHNIRNKEKSAFVKQKRIQRLNLDVDFKNWHVTSIMNLNK